MRKSRSLFLTAGALALAGLSACSGSSGGGGGGGVLALGTVSGTVRASGGVGLAGVTITAAGSMTITDVNGDFILVDLLPTGPTLFEFDGTTAVVPGSAFPILDVTVDLQNGTPTILPQVITLPDLLNVNSALDTVAVDGTGATIAPIAAAGAQADIAMTGAIGTVITLDGVPAAAPVDLNVTPVPPTEVPMPLPALGLLPASFVTVQPGNAAFNPPLNIILPNDLGYPVGTVVDIWSFDHDEGDWVNRSTETGNTGIVVDLGGGLTHIAANGVITEGGWHSPVIPVDPNCLTTLMGHIEDSLGNPIPNASVGFSTGQFTSSDTNGDFTMPGVPAYDVTASAGGPCVAIAIAYEAVCPPAYGSLATTGMVASGNINFGNTTIIPDISFVVPTTGAVAGLVVGDGASANENVFIDTVPPTGATPVAPNVNGSFSVLGLAPGNYTASFLFEDQAMPTVVDFMVSANEVETINVQLVSGVGNQNLTVLVMENPTTAAQGAKVTVVGTDLGSIGGLIGMTDATGRVTFQGVSGPFTVTAQHDILEPGAPPETVRHAQTLIGMTGSQIGMILKFDSDDAAPLGTTDATLSGTVSNFTVGAGENLFFDLHVTGTESDLFNARVLVDSQTGAYTIGIPSGYVFDGALKHMNATGESTIAGFIQAGFGPATIGQTLTLDMDFGTAATFSFDQTLDVTLMNQMQTSDFHDIFLCIETPDESMFFEFPLLQSSTGIIAAGSAMVMIPSLTHASFTGFQRIIGSEQESFTGPTGLDVECSNVFTTTPTMLTFDYPAPSVAIAPTQGQMLSAAQLLTTPISFTEGTFGVAPTNGPNLVFIESETPSPVAGIDAVRWIVWLPAGTSSVSFPPAALEMFGDAAVDYGFAVEQNRFVGTTFTYNTFFNGNVVQNLATINANFTAECETAMEFIFSTQ